MALRKCPRCELNYIKDDEKYCNVCRREMKAISQALCVAYFSSLHCHSSAGLKLIRHSKCYKFVKYLFQYNNSVRICQPL